MYLTEGSPIALMQNRTHSACEPNICRIHQENANHYDSPSPPSSHYLKYGVHNADSSARNRENNLEDEAPYRPVIICPPLVKLSLVEGRKGSKSQADGWHEAFPPNKGSCPGTLHMD